MTEMLGFIKKCAPPGHTFAAEYIYKDAGGEYLGSVARYDNGQDKTFKPFRYVEGKPACKGFDVPRPLYGLDLLAARPDDPVIVVEGEKAADTARSPGYVAVTSPHGALSAGQADWSPLVGRDDVTIWPDHDKAGIKYALDVQKLVPQAKIVSVPNHFPKGWDLADPNPAGVTDDDARGRRT